MKEELVTKSIMQWLIDNKWIILSYDFPQSGTGKVLHPNIRSKIKHKDDIIPDIIAVKGDVCVFLENKDKFYYPDFLKQNLLITSDLYSQDIGLFLKDYAINNIFYGIGMPFQKYTQRVKKVECLVDFLVCVECDKSITIPYNPNHIIFSNILKNVQRDSIDV